MHKIYSPLKLPDGFPVKIALEKSIEMILSLYKSLPSFLKKLFVCSENKKRNYNFFFNISSKSSIIRSLAVNPTYLFISLPFL